MNQGVYFSQNMHFPYHGHKCRKYKDLHFTGEKRVKALDKRARSEISGSAKRFRPGLRTAGLRIGFTESHCLALAGSQAVLISMTSTDHTATL